MDSLRVLDYLEKEYKKALEPYQNTVIKGNIGSFEEYKRLIGIIWGIEAALALVVETKKRLATGEDDDD